MPSDDVTTGQYRIMVKLDKNLRTMSEKGRPHDYGVTTKSLRKEFAAVELCALPGNLMTLSFDNPTVSNAHKEFHIL
ncbi:hypothetical protein Y032_0013g2133 [Ancylostoma ceylanicum]|uniref:Uncharacterized protein n=1 Tax=Ancylostoma ceylanicum TaxID=53326 RepID=A0A016VAZ5_9BILA|nr:hypothetical protein Y032_0013g2133 [Ancylostoma ceylanicum]